VFARTADAAAVAAGARADPSQLELVRRARRLLRRWPPDRERSMRSWNWSVDEATDVVRAHEAELRQMVGPNQRCEATGVVR